MGIEGEAAAHELDDALTKEQTEAKALGEHIDLGEFVEDKVGLVGRDAKPRVFYGEKHLGVGGFDTHGDTALAGKVEGIEKQLGKDNEQMMAVSLDGEFIGDATIQTHLSIMSNQTACIVKGLTSHFDAVDRIAGADHLMALDE